MTYVETHKNHSIIHYCVGMSLDGPIYVSHFLNCSPSKAERKSLEKSGTPNQGWAKLKNWFSHKHNN